MLAFTTLTSIPCDITQGEVVTWAETLTAYPCASYSVAYKFAGQTPQDGFQQFAIAGTESGAATYTFATPATPKPGAYSWEKQITLTAGSVMRVVERGSINVLPGLSVVPTVTFAAAQVALYKTVLARFAATDKQTVNFNGQSFTRFSIADYQKQLVYWQSQVIAEQAKIDALSGKLGGRIRAQFVRP